MSSLRAASAFDMRSVLASAVTKMSRAHVPVCRSTNRSRQPVLPDQSTCRHSSQAVGCYRKARPSPQTSSRTAALEDPGAARIVCG